MSATEINSKILEVVNGSEDISRLFETLAQDGVVEVNGTDKDVRPPFVTLQGVIEHVLATELQNEVRSLKGVIHTPMPATPLCTKGEISRELVDPSIENDPARLFTVKARTTILRDYLFKGGDLYVVYPKEGLAQRTEEQRAKYLEELMNHPTHLFDTPLDCDQIPNDLIGATYLFEDRLGNKYVFAIKMTQAKDPQDMGNFGLWFGPIDHPAIQKRLEAVSTFLEQNGSDALKTEESMDIQALLKKYVDENESVGASIGLIDQGKVQFFSYGKMSVDGDEPVTEDTLFEIGSITKVFTTLALMDMVHQGKMDLDDPIEMYLPGVKVPEQEGKKITLRHLATHRSGLPRVPDNLVISNKANPYATYSEENLYEFLNHYALPRAPGEQFEYSNVGMGLLGHILSLKSGQSYESLISDRILKKLHMDNTAITLTPEMQKHFATGHQWSKSVDHWDFLPCIAACGGLRSTVRDMTQFLAANLGVINSPLTDLLKECHEKQGAAVPKVNFGLGWFLMTLGNIEVINHDGGTGGFVSYLGFDPKSQKGMVILTNSTEDWPYDLGSHWIDSSVKQPIIDHALAKNPDYMNKFAGNYLATLFKGPNPSQQPLVIGVWGKRLYCALGDDGAMLYPEEFAIFGMKGFLEGKMHFTLDDAGKVSKVEGRLPDGTVLWEATPKEQ